MRPRIYAHPSVRRSVRNPLTKNAIMSGKRKETSTIVCTQLKFKKILENSAKFNKSQENSAIYWTHRCSDRTCFLIIPLIPDQFMWTLVTLFTLLLLYKTGKKGRKGMTFIFTKISLRLLISPNFRPGSEQTKHKEGGKSTMTDGINIDKKNSQIFLLEWHFKKTENQLGFKLKCLIICFYMVVWVC